MGYMLQDVIALFASLIGVPVLIKRGGEQRWQVKQWDERAIRADARRFRMEHPARPVGGGEESPSLFSTFIAAARVCSPPPLEAVNPLREDIRIWLQWHCGMLLRQMSRFQVTSRHRRKRPKQAKDALARRYTRDDLLERNRTHMRQKAGGLLLSARKPGGKRHAYAAGPEVSRPLSGGKRYAGTHPA